MKLVDDESEDGCYCTDEELKDMLTAEIEADAARTKSRTDIIAAAARQCEATDTETGAHDVPDAEVPESQLRAELVRALFLALDFDGDGALNEAEMRFFAGQTGFEGTDAEWSDEYRMLCSSYNGQVP